MNNLREMELDRLIEKRNYTASPDDWENQVLYFLLVDRFSHGKEDDLYLSDSDYGNAVSDEQSKEEWQKAGDLWNGGTLEGVKSKLGYLKKLGVTTIWISPVFKQVSFEDSYHGYGIQDFLDIDPHFGTPEDLADLVSEAHRLSMFVILDIIINHSGNVFSYSDGHKHYDGSVFPVAGFNDREGKPTIPIRGDRESQDKNGGIWPAELMIESTFTRKGQINNWDSYPEYIEGDFFSLKNIHTGQGSLDNFSPSSALNVVTECYKYWIAYADIDGFRLDTVKHVHPGAIKHFSREIHEFATRIGKSNFYIIGEITGGLNFAIDMLSKTGIDAALGINKIPEALENTAKGYVDAIDFFGLFKNSELDGEDKYKWYIDNVVTMFDDHDMVSLQLNKRRFCADNDTSQLLLNAVVLNAMSPGIPCLYYGTEQCFDGGGDRDKYVREAMFGGSFGAFCSRGKHFFDASNPVYKEISRILSLRKESLCLKQGRTYLREISYDGDHFDLPHHIGTGRYTGLIAWSRILSDQEIISIINCNIKDDLKIMVVIDNGLHKKGDILYCLYESTHSEMFADTEVFENSMGKCFEATIPKHGCTIFSNKRTISANR